MSCETGSESKREAFIEVISWKLNLNETKLSRNGNIACLICMENTIPGTQLAAHCS